AECAAAIGKIGVDVSGFEARLRVAQQIGDRFCRLVRRRHADNEFELLAAGVVPGKTAFRLESHRVDRLRLDITVQRHACWTPGLWAGGGGGALSAEGAAAASRCPAASPSQIGRPGRSKTAGLTRPCLTAE